MQSTSLRPSRLSNSRQCRNVARRVPALTCPSTISRHSIHSRDLRAGAGTSAAKDGWWKVECPSNMKDVTSIQELVDEMADNQDRLVVVDFYAAWCNSCRSLFPKLKKMSAENPNIVVLKVNFDENKQLCKSMGIKVLPYFHMYKGAEGRVDAFTASITKIQRLKDAIELHGAPFCSLQPSPGVPEFPEVKPHHDDASHDREVNAGSQDQEHSNIVGFAKTSQQQQPTAV